MENTIQIEGTEYRVQTNDDPDCSISIGRIYKTGETRNRYGVDQMKQADGSWRNMELGHKGRSWSGR